MSEYQRRCVNWITTFKEWTLDRCEAPESYVLWTGIWTLAAALRRRVFIPKQLSSTNKMILGSWTCYPYLYVMFVGPPGMRKTTTLGYAIDLLENVPDLPLPPTFITAPALVDDILKAPESSVYLTIEEFGDIILKGGTEMYEFLTSMYDGKKNIRQKTLARSDEYAEKPTINMIAATTPEWIVGNMPASVIGGGLASRVNWIYEDKLRELHMYYRHVKKNFANLYNDLLADLVHISKLEGEFDIQDDAMDFMESFYQNMQNSPKTARLKRFPGYLNRKPVMIHKVAMILHLAYSNELNLTIDDFKSAIKMVEMLEPNLPKVFVGVGKNEYALEMRDIIDFVKLQGEVPEAELREYFQYAASPAKLSELIDGVLMLGDSGIKSKLSDENNRRIFIPGSDI